MSVEPTAADVRLILVDDHAMVRGGLRRVLESEPGLAVVAEAGNITDGLRLARSLRPDVVVVDISMPDGSGIDLVRQLRQDEPEIGLVVLTMHGEDDILFRALDAGASSLVLKTASLDEVIVAVRRAAVSPDVFSAAGLGAAMRRRISPAGPRLTPRELEVLNLLKDGLSIGQAAKRLFLSESTIKTHVAKVYDKLGATNRTQAVMEAVRLRLVDPNN